MKKLSLLFILIISTSVYCQKFDKLALTPPMGWNSWNRFGCNINEKLIRETADALVSSGLKDAGIGSTDKSLKAVLPSHDVLMLRLGSR